MRTLEQVDEKMALLVEYLYMKIDDRDWHGVADCAMDLRDLEAEKLVLREINARKRKVEKPKRK